MVETSDTYDGGWEEMNESGEGIDAFMFVESGKYDRHGNLQPAYRWGSRHQIASIPFADRSDDVPNPELEIRTGTNERSAKESRSKNKQTRTNVGAKNTAAPGKSVVEPSLPTRRQIVEAEAEAVRILSRDLRITSNFAKQLLVRYENAVRIAKHLPTEQKESSFLNVMGLTPERFEEFLSARERYLVNREVTIQSDTQSSQLQEISEAMKVSVEEVLAWRKNIDDIVGMTRRVGLGGQFERIASQMQLTPGRLKKLISVDPEIARALRGISARKPQQKTSPINNNAHKSLREPKRAPGVRSTGISDLDSENQCGSCGVVPDQNGFCGCT